jgi:prophage regulatory protein
MTLKLVSKKDLKSVYGIPYSFVHSARLEHAGSFPTRIELGECRVAWLAEEVEEWIAERVAQHMELSERFIV